MDSISSRRRRPPAYKGGRPCDACRRRKTRCITDAGQEKCNVCVQRQNPCTFDLEPPRRPQGGPSRESAVPSPGNSLHSALHSAGNTLHDILVAQASPSPQDVLNNVRFSGQGGSPTTTLSNNILNAEPEDRTALVSVSGEPDRWSRSLGLDTSRFAELYGLGSDMEPILMRHRPYTASGNEYTLPTHSIRRVQEQDQGVDYPLTFHMVSDEKSTSFMNDHTQVDAIESCIRPHGEALLKLFWKFVHPPYPILYQEGFAERYNKSYRSVDAALLGSIYLNAINWWSFDTHLSHLPVPNVANLRRLTLNAIQNSYHRPRLSSIEAALLLLQCKPEDPLNPDHTFAWGLTAQALATGEACGLHLDASSWDIPNWERNLRKRLSWALYMQDVWTALAHGRPSHISEDDWAVTVLDEYDFADSEGTQIDGSHFMHMASLAQILYSTLKRFYTIRSSLVQDTVKLSTMAQPLFDALESWQLALPPHLSMESLPSRQLCPTANLHLSYFGVKINILRRLVRSTALAPLCLDVPTLSHIRQRAHETAQQATALVSSLRLEHLDAFWYFAAPYLFSLIGSFCTLLLVTSLTAPERDHWREILNSYLWTLRVMSKSNEPMRYAVNRLEGAILRGLEHALVVSVEGSSPMALEATPGQQFEGDVNGFDFGFTGSETLDFNNLDLDAFDFLSNAPLG